MSRTPRPVASRLAALGAALSVAAAGAAPLALATDAAVTPGASRTTLPAPKPADDTVVDDDLIEFLGSVGDTADDGDWLDFLTNTDIDKVAKRGSKTPPRGR